MRIGKERGQPLVKGFDGRTRRPWHYVHGWSTRVKIGANFHSKTLGWGKRGVGEEQLKGNKLTGPDGVEYRHRNCWELVVGIVMIKVGGTHDHGWKV